MQEAGATADLELAYTLADGVEYIRAGLEAGLDDRRVRAAAVLLLGDRHELLHGGRQDARGPRALGAAGQRVRAAEPQVAARCAPTARPRGWSLTAQDVFNNVGRTCIEAMAATQGHTQSLHTNALDEAIALPTDFSRAHRPQHPAAAAAGVAAPPRSSTRGRGSYYVERLTHDLAERAWAHIQEVEAAGGMAKAIEQGIPKMRIEEAAARTQARIDSGAQKVIGVNTYRLAGRGRARRAPGRQRRRLPPADRQARAAARRARRRRRTPLARRASPERRRVRRRQPARARGRRRARQGHGRRDLRRHGEGRGAGTRP